MSRDRRPHREGGASSSSARRLLARTALVALAGVCAALAGCKGDETSGPAPLPDGLTWGFHSFVWIMTTVDWQTAEQVEGESDRLIARNLDYLVARRHNTLLIDVLDPEGGAFFFTSPTLTAAGYTQGEQLMESIVEQAHERGLEVLADPTVLAWRLDPELSERHGIGGTPLTTDQVKQVVRELVVDAGFDGIVEETFPPQYIAAIAEVTKKQGKRYIHKFDDRHGHADVLMSEDYVGFLSSTEHVDRVAATGADANNIGYFSMMFTHARALGKPAWVKVGGGFDLPDGAEHNVLLLRAVQFASAGYFWMPSRVEGFSWLNDRLKIDPLIDELERLRQPLDEQKPLVNVVLALPWGQGRPADREAFLFVNQAFGPVANGLLLAGYELRTTYDTPLTDADAYVVLAIGQGAEAQADLPQAIAALLEGDKPVVLVVDGLTSNGAWGESLPLLGVSAAWTPALSTARIDNATFDGSPVAWHGFPIWNSLPLTAVIREADVVGEALVSGEIEGQPAALVVKQGNKYLVNANLLHLQSSFICNQLLAPTLHEPFAGYGIVGQRSAFLALADTPLTVELPFDAGTEVRVIRYGADGAPQSADTVAYSEPLATSLNQHELLIVEPTSR